MKKIKEILNFQIIKYFNKVTHKNNKYNMKMHRIHLTKKTLMKILSVNWSIQYLIRYKSIIINFNNNNKNMKIFNKLILKNFLQI